MYIFPYRGFAFYHISKLRVRTSAFIGTCHFSICTPSLKCGSSCVRHTLVVGAAQADATRRDERIVSHTEKRRGSVTTRTYRRQWAPTRRATGRWPYQMLGRSTQCHVHAPICAQPRLRGADASARLSVHHARTHIVTSVARETFDHLWVLISPGLPPDRIFCDPRLSVTMQADFPCIYIYSNYAYRYIHLQQLQWRNAFMCLLRLWHFLCFSTFCGE